MIRASWHSIAALFLVLLTGGTASAQPTVEIVRVPYGDIAPDMGGRVDFEAFELVAYPGQTFNARLRFPGLSTGEAFIGQIPFLRGQADRATRGLGGRPSLPFEIAARPLRLGVFADGASNVLFSAAPTPRLDGTGLLYNHGGGTVALRFANMQRRLGFRVVVPNAFPAGGITLSVRFYGDNGAWIGSDPILLHQADPHGFATSDDRFRIKGVSVEPMNGARFAINDIIFDVPMLLGDDGSRRAQRPSAVRTSSAVTSVSRFAGE